MQDQTLSWRSDDSVDGCHLLAAFAFGTGAQGRNAVAAEFCHSGAPDDAFHCEIPIGGSRVRVEHVFRNGLELSGDFRVMTHSGPSSLGVWGHFSFGEPRTVSKIYFEGLLVRNALSSIPPPEGG
jgi:hypothetical protein